MRPTTTTDFKHTIILDEDIIITQTIMEEPELLHLEHYTIMYEQHGKDKEWNFTINCN